MKFLFAAIAMVLCVASAATYLSYPDLRSDVPVIYWVTDVNPARAQQVRGFHAWQIRTGRGEQVAVRTMDDAARLRARVLSPAILDAIRIANPNARRIWDGTLTPSDLPLSVRVPVVELRVDSGNRELAKQVIQGVSGVGGDVMDAISGEGIRYLQSMGLLDDITDSARQMGFSTSATYPAIESEITVDGRQYAFPCNVFQQDLLWANKATFAKYGLSAPPRRWTLDDFERIGKQLVAAANPPGERHAVFLADELDPEVLHRSLGLSRFNETLTRCTLDDPRYVQVLELLHKWIYQDRILPSTLEQSSFSTSGGYAGTALQLFNTGNYAMFAMGRYALIQLREYGDLELSVSEFPNGGFPNTLAETRAATIYAGGKHKDLAKQFLTYLASEDYGNLLVDDADGQPPNPSLTQLERYTHPPAHHNEWGVHEVFSDATREISIGRDYSPFVLAQDVFRLEKEIRERFMNDQISARQAATVLADRINRRIARSLDDDRTGKLRAQYDKMVNQQREIDQLRAEGKKVPLALIPNTFLRHYYQFKGWAE